MEWCNAYASDHYDGNSLKTITKHKQMIARCFYSNTIEEIMDNLSKETEPFAKQILDRMNQNSMLSMKIALKMLRRAVNMDYGQVLKMELNAQYNKLEDNEFDHGVSQILLKPHQTKKFKFN